MYKFYQRQALYLAHSSKTSHLSDRVYSLNCSIEYLILVNHNHLPPLPPVNPSRLVHLLLKLSHIPDLKPLNMPKTTLQHAFLSLKETMNSDKILQQFGLASSAETDRSGCSIVTIKYAAPVSFRLDARCYFHLILLQQHSRHITSVDKGQGPVEIHSICIILNLLSLKLSIQVCTIYGKKNLMK